MKRAGFLDQSERTTKHSGAIRHILAVAETPRGRYPVTLAFLDLLSTLLSFIQTSSSHSSTHISLSEFYPYLSFLRTDLFSSYETWRYLRILERWEIGIKILDIFDAILMEVPITSQEKEEMKHNRVSLRDSLLESILYDSSFHHTLLNIIGIGHKTLESLFNTRKVKEAQTLETLISKGLLVLLHVLLGRGDSVPTSPPSLEHSIFTRTVGRENQHFILILTSYIHYTYNVQLPLLSTRIMAILCRLTVGESTFNQPSLIGYLTNHTHAIQSSYLHRLRDPRENVLLRSSILHLITETLNTQPGLAELFLNLSTNSLEERQINKTSCMHFVLTLLMEDTKSKDYSEKLLCESLQLLACLWEAAPDYYSLVVAVRSYPNFWSQLVKLLDMDVSSAYTTSAGVPYRLFIHASILQIISLELFYAANQQSESPLDTYIAKINERHTTWLKQYTSFTFDTLVLSTFETNAKTLHIDIEALTKTLRIKNYDTFRYDTYILEHKHIKSETMANFLSHLHKVNKMLMVAEAQLQLLKQWRILLHITLINLNLGLPLDTVYKIAEGLSEVLQHRSTDGPFVENSNQEITEVILLLVSTLTTSAVSEAHKKKFNGVTIVNNLASALQRIIVATESPSLLQSLFASMLHLLQYIPATTWQDVSDQAFTIGVQACSSLVKPKLRNVCLALLDIIISSAPDTDTRVAQYLQNNGVFSVLIQYLAACMQDLPTGHSTEASPSSDPLFALFLSLAQNPHAAESLAINGIMTLLSNDSFFLFQHLVPHYDAQGERNKWHNNWCIILTIVASMLRSLGYSEKLLDQCLEFVNIHHVRLAAALGTNNVFTMGALEETQRVTALLYQLNHYAERWHLVSNSPVAKLQHDCLLLLQYHVLMLGQPTLLARQSVPMTKQEKKDNVLPEKAAANEPSVEDTKFVQAIEKELYRIMSNVLSVIRIATPDYSKDSLDSSHWTPLFSPYLETNINSPPSLGTLLSCQDVCAIALRKFSATGNFPLSLTLSEVKQNTHAIRALLLYNIETVLYIMLPHIMVALANHSLRQKVREEVGSELETFLNRLNRDLAKMATTDKSPYLLESIEFHKRATLFVAKTLFP